MCYTLIRHVDEIYLEADLNGADTLNWLNATPTDFQLANVVSAEEYEKVKTFFLQRQPQVPFYLLEQQPPLMLTSSLYEFLLPCQQTNGIEACLIEAACKFGKVTKGLETLAFQSKILHSIPFTEQAADLVKAIDNLEKYRELMYELLQVYKQQDVEKLYTLSIQDEGSLTSHLDAMLYNRNIDWVTKFVTIATEKSTLLAVGAAHLGGEKGLLRLLKQQGYLLRPIENRC